MAQSKVVTEETFSNDVLSSKIPVLVDFWAPWCGPCKIIGPILEDLSTQYEEKIQFGKLNVDENQNIAIQYQVQSIPTLIFYKGGKEVNRIIGVSPKEEIEKALNGLLES